MIFRTKIIVILFVIAAFGAVSSAQELSQSQGLSSGPEARTLYEIASQLYKEPGSGSSEAEQAIVLLNAAVTLDERSTYILPEVINVCWLYPEQDYTDAVHISLDRYINASSDLEVPTKAVQYLLERLNSREERENLLVELITRLGSKNDYFASDLATQLGLLMAEKPDVDAANFYLMQAYNVNKYNKLAFAKLLAIGVEPPDSVIVLIHLRNMMIVNPLDFESAFNFAQTAESLMLHSLAADGYQYCADLFVYLNADKPLPRSLYLPWLQSCYNMEGNQNLFRDVIDKVRRQGGFDIIAEAIAAKSAMKIADTSQADNIFRRIDAESHAILSVADAAQQNKFVELAWYYGFIKPDEQKALTWATKAYEVEPNSPRAASVFAYALKINDQDELAEPIAEQFEQQEQIAAITKALIVGGEDVESAAKNLKSAIAMNPASLEAAYAKTLLIKYSSEYIFPINLAALMAGLESEFGVPVVTKFVGMKKIISTKLRLGGVEFSYGRKINPDLIITNTSSQMLVISDDSLFKGNIRVDCRIKGDMKADIPNLISKKIRPSDLIKPGGAISVPLEIMFGRFGKLLNNYPQADLQIELTAYLEPVVDANGNVFSAIDIAPTKLSFRRKKLVLNLRYLQQRFDAISDGRYGQKVKSARLFAGLLAEQQSMAETGPLYKLMYAEPELLKSALARIMEDDNWNIKVQALAAVLPLKLDYSIIEDVSVQLGDENWPVRVMAAFILAKSQQQRFQNVTDWLAEHDQSQIVRDMVIALGAAPPKKSD